MDTTRINYNDYLYQMNFMLYLSDHQTDILDNPYFEVKPYIMDDAVNYHSRPPTNDSEL